MAEYTVTNPAMGAAGRRWGAQQLRPQRRQREAQPPPSCRRGGAVTVSATNTVVFGVATATDAVVDAAGLPLAHLAIASSARTPRSRRC